MCVGLSVDSSFILKTTTLISDSSPDLLTLMYSLDFYDIIFFIKAVKQPSSYFNIYI